MTSPTVLSFQQSLSLSLKTPFPRNQACVSDSFHFLLSFISSPEESLTDSIMKMFLMLMFFMFLPSLFQVCYSTTIVVDGVSEWKNPTVHIGDSIVFKHKYHHYDLFIFQNQRAFNLCNFSHATLLNKPNSTYTWHPSRPGTFFFSFSNGPSNSCNGSQKLAIKVSASSPPQSFHLSPELPPMAAPAAAPISGGVVSSSPAYPWPFQPSQPPSASSPLSVPSLLPEKGGSLPFINSNPAVPLPTGEVDSATIRPLATSDHGTKMMMGFLALQLALLSGLFLLP